MICFDGQIVIDPSKPETFSRGINVVVINSKLKAVMDYRAFDTYASIESCLELVQYLSFNVPPRSQILVATHDEVTVSLCPKAKELLQAFGSRSIKGIKYRETWAFVGERGLASPQSPEKLTSRENNQEFAERSEIEGCIKIPMSDTVLPMNEDFGMTLDVCGMVGCNYNDISLFVNTGQQMYIKPTVCVAGYYVIKPGIRGGRGFNFVVVDPLTKSVTASRQFDSYAQESSGIDLFLESIGDGVILVGLVHDDGSVGLQNSTRKLLADFGASMIWEIRLRSVMYFAGRKGLMVSPFQEVAHAADAKSFPQPLEKRMCLPSEIMEKSDEKKNENKEKFCKNHQGYGTFCYAHSSTESLEPPSIALPSLSATAVTVYDVPILVIAGSNHLALTATLTSLVAVPGLKCQKVVVVYPDVFSVEYDDLVGLFKFIKLPLSNVSASHELLESGLSWVFKNDTAATFAIVIEDEVIVAPDFLDYMQHAMVAMTAQPTVAVASAWNPNSFRHAAANDSAVLYVDSLVGFAFLVSKSFYTKHMQNQMSTCCRGRSWLGWFSGDRSVDRYRFIMPEVARADLYRSSDNYLLSSSTPLAALTRGRRLPLFSPTPRSVSILPLPQYEQFVHQSVSHWVHSSGLMPYICVNDAKADDKQISRLQHNASRSLTIVYNQEHSADYSALLELCDCFQLVCLSTPAANAGPIGMFGGILRFSLRGQPAYLLGSKSKYLSLT